MLNCGYKWTIPIVMQLMVLMAVMRKGVFMRSNNTENEGVISKTRLEKYTKSERLGIVKAVARDTNGKVCELLLKMLSLHVKDEEVEKLIEENHIIVTYEKIEEIPAKVNLEKDQEYALVAGLQRGIDSDFCMKHIIKHYHIQQSVNIRKNVPTIDKSQLSDITDELMCEAMLKYFDLRKNTSLVSLLNSAVPKMALREYVFNEHINGKRYPEYRRNQMTKIKNYLFDRCGDLDNVKTDDIQACYEEIGKKYDISMMDIMDIWSDLMSKSTTLYREAEERDILESTDTEKIVNTTASLENCKSAENHVVATYMASRILELVKSLSYQEEAILVYRYGLLGKEQLTRNEIASELGLELKELHSIERKAMNQLKKVILNEEPELRDLINYA